MKKIFIAALFLGAIFNSMLLLHRQKLPAELFLTEQHTQNDRTETYQTQSQFRLSERTDER
jgi:hypothetical protein